TTDEDDLEPPDPIREPPEHDEEWCSDDERHADQHVDHDVIELERRAQEEEGPELAGVPDDPLASGRAQQRQDDVLVVRIVKEALVERLLRSASFRRHSLEDRRLLELEPDVHREREEDDRNPKWNAPTPGTERILLHESAATADDHQRHQQAQGGRG